MEHAGSARSDFHMRANICRIKGDSFHLRKQYGNQWRLMRLVTTMRDLAYLLHNNLLDTESTPRQHRDAFAHNHSESFSPT